MSNKKVYTVPSAPLFFSILSSTLTLLSFTFLSSHLASATDTSVDDITIAVPASCSLEGTNKEHTATINNGTYNSSIGLTTMKAYCNDPEGFAIYAIGYTNEEDGNNVLTSTTLGSTADIVTGTATSGNTSNWAMKLATITDPAPTYPITIENGFNNFHNVPDDYTLVAKRTASTDVGSAATGSTLTSTYQAYISPTQPAGTYNGKVKYVLVHPNYVDSEAVQDAVTVIYNGNGLTFSNGATTNTVKYANVCQPGNFYVGNTTQISKSENVTDRNTYTPIESGDYTSDTVTISGADKLKIVLHYDFDPKGTTDSNANAYMNISDNYYLYQTYYGMGDKTIIADGDTAYFYFEVWGTVDTDHDYGYYAEVYPVYETEQSGTTSETLITNDCSIIPISGTYMETTEWHDKWIATIDGYEREFTKWYYLPADDFPTEGKSAEDSIKNYIQYNLSAGTDSITVYSFNPVTFDMVYAAAGKTKLNNYYKMQDLTASMCADVTKEETTTVIDIRDDSTYEIIKTKDGNCWMRENLKLDPTDTTTAANLSATNTNATNDAIYNYLNGGNSNHNEGWTSVAVAVGDGVGSGAYKEPRIQKVYAQNLSGLGYNLCAVSVGTYCYPGTCVGSGCPQEEFPSTGSQTMSYDICPVNWKLPFNEYGSLISAYGAMGVDEELSLELGGALSIYVWAAPSSLSSTGNSYQFSGGYYGRFEACSGSSCSFYRYRHSLNLVRCVINASE